MADKIGVTELNEILLNSMPNSWYKQAYVQGFDCEYILYKKAVNMFEHIEIAEIVYEGVVTPSSKKTTRSEANCTGLSRKKRVEASSSNNHPTTYGCTGNRRKQYVDFLKSELKNRLIHGLGHSSDECKVLGEFGTKYDKIQTTKD